MEEVSEKEVLLLVKLYHTNLSINKNGNNIKKGFFNFKRDKKIENVGSLLDFGNKICTSPRNIYPFLNRLVEMKVFEDFMVIKNIKYFKLNKRKIYEILKSLPEDSLYKKIWNLINTYDSIIE